MIFNFTCADCKHIASRSTRRKVIEVKIFDDSCPIIRELHYGHNCGPTYDLRIREYGEYSKETKHYGTKVVKLFKQRKFVDPFGGFPMTVYLQT